MLDAALAHAEDLTLAVTADDPPEVAPIDPSPIPAELVPLGTITEAAEETSRVTLTDVLDAVGSETEERKETSEADAPNLITDTPDLKTDTPVAELDHPESVAEPDPPESGVADDPRDPWDVGLERLRDLAKGRADVGGNAALDWARRERLLTWMAEPKDQGGGQGSWNVLVSALTAAAVPDDEPTLSPDFQAAAQALEQAAPLEVRDLRFCKRVLGFGDYEPFDDDRFKPGQSIILYCELAGLRFEPAGDRIRSRLSSVVEVAPASGGEPVWTCSLGKADDVCRRRRRDYYVNYRIPLPETLAPGSYQLRLVLTDAIGNRTTTRSLPFTISP